MDALDDADFDRLYTLAWTAMVRLGCLLLGDVAAAEDAVQDAFVNTYRHWTAIAGAAAARAYLRVAVVNACRSVGRKRATASRALVRQGNAELGLRDGTAAPAGSDPDLIAALRALTRRQREVLVLRYWADLSEREIAETLRISAGTVKSTAARALRTLHERLEAPDAQR
jgi:RNA polymerase sigma-70 factor (sigma-E family)